MLFLFLHNLMSGYPRPCERQISEPEALNSRAKTCSHTGRANELPVII